MKGASMLIVYLLAALIPGLILWAAIIWGMVK